MSEKKSIALCSVTLNAVNPMTAFLQKNAPAFEVRNYLDSYLQGKIRKEGGILPASMKRMTDMIATACEDGADAVVLTCTVFSPYQPYFEKLFPVPVICPDGAMLDTVSKQPGKKAILCTFASTIEPTKKLYQEYCRKNGTPEEVTMVLLEEAAALQAAGDPAGCEEEIRRKARGLDASYDHIVLAQISMAGAAEGLQLTHASLHTSPASALAEVRKAIM